jgi:quinol monooxygenase YgiN
MGLILPLATVLLASAPLGARQEEKSPIERLIERIKAVPGQGDKPFCMVVHFKVKRDQVDAVLEAAKKAVPPSRAEKGCAGYDLEQNLEDPTEFFLLESWHDTQALRDHAATPHFADFIKVIGASVEEPPKMGITKMVVAKDK